MSGGITYTFTATVTSEDLLTDTQSWPFTVGTTIGASGSNVNAATYSAGVLSSNIATWNSAVGSGYPLNVRRVEQPNPIYDPTKFDSTDANRMLVISVSPSLVTSPPSAQNSTDLNSLTLMCQTISAKTTTTVNGNPGLGLTNVRFILYHEPTTPVNYPTAAQYQASIEYYAPAVQTYFPLDFGWSVGTSAKEGMYASYFMPGVFDGVMGDMYCRAYNGGVSMAGVAGLADNNTANGVSKPLPLGMGEWGFNPNATFDTTANITNFINYMAGGTIGGVFVPGFWADRVAAGKVNSYLCWFNPPYNSGTNTPTNPNATNIGSSIWSSSTSPQVADFQLVWTAFD